MDLDLPSFPNDCFEDMHLIVGVCLCFNETVGC